MAVPANLNNLNYPIESDIQQKFWGSKHRVNYVKSIICFSLDLSNANDNLRRYGFSRSWRHRAIKNFGQFVNTPDFTGVPFSEMKDAWWIEMPAQPSSIDPAVQQWLDDNRWS